jgi:hypothetical protein
MMMPVNLLGCLAGNSGGPLLDSSGCLIGINTAIYSPSGANSGVGFAIPVDVVRSSVDQIIAFGRVVRPILGISFAPDQSSEQLGVKGGTSRLQCAGCWLPAAICQQVCRHVEGCCSSALPPSPPWVCYVATVLWAF